MSIIDANVGASVRLHRGGSGDIVIVVVESCGDPGDSQIERTIGFGDPGNRRRKDPVVCIEGIDNRVCYRVEGEYRVEVE
jgi:hypothetical protein